MRKRNDIAKLSVFDPPMCCSTSVCGPSVGPVLPRFAAGLDWFKRRGIEVERYNLAQQPRAFASNPVVTGALREHGNDCLPLLLVDGRVVSRGAYPGRAELAGLVGIGAPTGGDAPEADPPSCYSGPGVMAIDVPSAGRRH